MTYPFKTIESKWQKAWASKNAFRSKKDSKKKKFYVMEMFPYPSALGLHMGHALNYTIGDIYARFKRMSGFNVLYPMGFDSLGLPAENAAIKAGAHPKPYTKKAISNYMKQMKNLGLSYDWSKLVNTMEPEYYKWNQLFFLKFLEKGLAYKKKAAVNWCPKCKTVLANEQVHNGKCWRHETKEVEIKHLEQWFLKITDYADELLECIPDLKWPQKIKTMQKNWIGKSYGTEILFKINNEQWSIFTTRPDTIYGVTFMVVSAQHPKLMNLVTVKHKPQVQKFLKKIKSVSEKDLEDLEKEGVFTGSYATNPLTNEQIPIYAGNFVVAEYGSGMVMAVPAHDQRDFEFAKRYNLPIKEVIKGGEVKNPFGVEALIETNNTFLFQGRDKGTKISPNKIGVFGGGVKKGESSLDAIKRELKEELSLSLTCDQITFVGAIHSPNENGRFHNLFYVNGVDKNKLNLKEGGFIFESKLSDLLKNKKISPFAKLAINSFMNKQDRAFTGEGILINSDKFNGLKNKEAISKITQHLEKKKLGKKAIQFKMRDWLISRQRYWGTPIPIIYCDKCGIVPVPEKQLPVKLPDKVKFGKGNPLATNEKFLNTKCLKCGGKARRETDTMDTFVDSSWYFMRYPDNKNAKQPFDKKIEEYWLPVDQYIGGIEHATMHLLYARFWTKALRDLGYIKYDEPFLNLFNQGMLHGEDGNKMSKSIGNVILPETVSEKYGIDTARFFLMSLAAPDKPRNWDSKGIQGSLKFMNKVIDLYSKVKIEKSSPKVESKLNSTIKEVTQDIESFKYNLAVIKIRDLFNSLGDEENKQVLNDSLKLLHPFCPHITEELWSKLGNKGFISLEPWPKADEKKIDKNLEKQDLMISKLKSDIEHIKKLTGKKQAKVYVYVLPNELEIYKGLTNIQVFAVNDKSKYDPDNKSKKVKPGRPGIYLE
ncbi:MAG: class I tRNA ligase family protein [archaeon]